jgi:hypothetical protein
LKNGSGIWIFAGYDYAADKKTYKANILVFKGCLMEDDLDLFYMASRDAAINNRL